MRRRENIRRNNKKSSKTINKKFIFIAIAIFVLIFISTVFSLFNIGNKRIINGVRIGNIDVSNLTQDEAIEKIEKWKHDVLSKEVNPKFEDIEEHIQVGTEIDSEKLVRNACNIGKSGNILKDNFEIIYTALFKKEIELDISIKEEELDKKIEEINLKLPGAMEEIDYYIEEDNLIIKTGKSGIKIQEEEFKELFIKALINENKEFEIPVFEAQPKKINIDEIYNEIHKEVKDAYITQDPIEVHPEVNGVDFEKSIEEVKEQLKEEKEEYIIPLKITLAEVTIEDLGKEAFPHLLGKFSTTYNTGNENRSTNLQLASEKIDGTIVLPGETFSYNKVVGQRTISAGYKEAAVYSGGKVVDGIGGGICQISSTLYNAVVYANLEVTSRSNHRFMTSYVEAGRDATVSWGTVDFCFENTRKYPIKVLSSVKNGVVTCEIYGMKEEKEYEIVIENYVEELIPYSTTYVKDYSMDEGTEEIKQNGANGARSITYKITKENGIVLSEEILSQDTYSPLEKIVKRGMKKQEGAAPVFAFEDEEIEQEKEEKTQEINPDLLEMIKEL